jgi:hypothetical protein
MNKLNAAEFYALCDAVTYRATSVSSAVGATELGREIEGLARRLAELNAAEPKRSNASLKRAWLSAVANGEQTLASAKSRLARRRAVVAVDESRLSVFDTAQLVA